MEPIIVAVAFTIGSIVSLAVPLYIVKKAFSGWSTLSVQARMRGPSRHDEEVSSALLDFLSTWESVFGKSEKLAHAISDLSIVWVPGIYFLDRGEMLSGLTMSRYTIKLANKNLKPLGYRD